MTKSNIPLIAGGLGVAGVGVAIFLISRKGSDNVVEPLETEGISKSEIGSWVDLVFAEVGKGTGFSVCVNDKTGVAGAQKGPCPTGFTLLVKVAPATTEAAIQANLDALLPVRGRLIDRINAFNIARISTDEVVRANKIRLEDLRWELGILNNEINATPNSPERNAMFAERERLGAEFVRIKNELNVAGALSLTKAFMRPSLYRNRRLSIRLS